MPPEMTYPTTRPHWLAETVAQARRPGQRSKPAKRPLPKSPGSTPAVALGSLASRAMLPKSADIVAIMAAVCTFHGIPLALGLTVLDHENIRSFTEGFGHSDGLMQTNSATRKDMIPRIPLPLKLQLLEPPANDRTDPVKLDQRLHDEFPKRVAVRSRWGCRRSSSACARSTATPPSP